MAQEIELPDLNAGLTPQQIEENARIEAARLVTQKAFLATYLDSLKYDDNVVCPE